jgi:sugar phosphate isomerase/epimerase
MLKTSEKDCTVLKRIISMSSVPYDGYDFARALESMAACGVTHVEPAFIIGYSGPIDDGDFTAAKARQYAGWLANSGIACHAFSAHNIQFDRADVVDVYRGRMDFAAGMGAKIINVTAAARADSAAYFRHIDAIARHAEQLGIMIGLENPGDGQDNLFNTASDGIALLEKLGYECIRLNYDAGNTISHRPLAQPGGADPAPDALLAMPYCAHVHIKDVHVGADGCYFFTPLGQGDIDCASIVQAVARTDLNLTIEMPLRLHRLPNKQPRRRGEPVPLPEVEAAIRESLHFVEHHLAIGRRSNASLPAA